MSTINLDGLDKAAILAALYNGARPQGLGFLHYDPTPMTEEEARGLGHGYFDYLKGRVMKVDLSGDTLDPWLYDRDNGAGAAERIINGLRSSQNVNPEEAALNHHHGRLGAAVELKERLNETTTFGNGSVTLGPAEFAPQLAPVLEKVLTDETAPTTDPSTNSED